MRAMPWTKYLLAFLITAFIFATASIANNFFNTKRIAEIRSIEESISIDILSLETQFDLLQEQSCKNISEDSVLSRELDTLARKLSYAEAQLGADNEEVLRLKRHYSLLEIKDLLLMQKVSEKCALEPIFLLYFYSNEKGTCTDCKRQGYVLTELSKEYPQLRIYSFDYNLDLSAVETLISLHDVSSDLPALVINDSLYTGFQSMEEIQKIIPELTKAATSTSEVQ
ncbi:MAG: hypothetical protein CMI56_01175 [Parcubacteria group bacterium]|jgi:hypothetical protein|nr:hypothetical protein [Parcubacteria group bacterium]|tara:strand:- start:28 stop:705 length:678 start_codon:yes stop_codon:yes gene_type:complete